MPARIFIFIPVYNAGPYVAEAIKSVLAQTYGDWELFISDDQSTDDSFEVCSTFAKIDPRVTVVRNDCNLGMVGNWNAGITKCKSELFIKLDADDRWLPTLLEESVKVIEDDPSVGIVFSRYVNIDSNGSRMIGSETTLPEFARNKSFSCVPLVRMGVDKMLQFPILRQGVSLMRKRIFEDAGVYRILLSPATQAASDTEFYFRIGCHYHIFCIDKVLYEYRIHAASITARDDGNYLQERKYYEVRTVVNDYYFGQKKISKQEWKRNQRYTEFKYNLFLNYRSRVSKDYLSFGKSVLKMLTLYPIQSVSHIKDRLIQNAMQ